LQNLCFASNETTIVMEIANLMTVLIWEDAIFTHSDQDIYRSLFYITLEHIMLTSIATFL